MNINWVIWVLLSLAALAKTYRTAVKWVDSLTKYITQNSKIRQVTFFANFEHPIHPNMEEILNEVSKKVPTIVTDTKELTVQNSSILDNASNPSSTLYIYYQDSRSTILPLDNIIDSVAERFGVKTRPKLLLVLFTRVLHDTLQKLLEYAWTHQDFLDFTIIELCGNEEKIEDIIGVESSGTISVIHQLNPFKKIYIRQIWTSDTEWFPNKLENMWGHPLKIGIGNYPPYATVKFNDRLELIEFSGINSELMKDLGRVLNFSLDLLRLATFLPKKFDITLLEVQKVLEERKVDVLANPFSSVLGDSLRSVMIRESQLCAIVPVMTRTSLPLSLRFVLAPLVSFAIVASFSILKQMFRFRGRIWQPFNILRVFFGIGVDHRPVGNADRTIFVCLLFVSSIFSTTIYTDLTDVSLRIDGEREFNSFDDLDSSGLTPFIEAARYDTAFASNDHVLNSIKKKTLNLTQSLQHCIRTAVEYKNVTCIMTDSQFGASEMIESKDRDRLKIAQPCFAIAEATLYFAKGSPYRSRINHVLRMLRDTGFLHKWYNPERDSSKSKGEMHWQSVPGTKQNMKLIRNQLLAVAIVGYSVAFLALVAEIVTSKIVKYRLFRRLKIIRIGRNIYYRLRR